MKSCTQHKREVAGVTDMKLLAEMIGDLHYESLRELLGHLRNKIAADGRNDYKDGRKSLSHSLINASNMLYSASVFIDKALQISKPFMDNE